MNANDIFRNSRFENIRELKTQLSEAVKERDSLRIELETLKAHFATALMASCDAEKVGEDGEIIVVDGWNAVLNNRTEISSTVQEAACRYLAENSRTFIWIVFDGDKAASSLGEDGKLRVTYTGGNGEHRADRMICDFARMLRFSGKKVNLTVHTNDKDFRKEVMKLGAKVLPADTLWRIES